jgi:hypothetical protein
MAASPAITAERESFQAALFRYVAAERPEIIALEWSAKIVCNDDVEPGCPVCRSPKRSGHAFSCRLGAIVRAVR